MSIVFADECMSEKTKVLYGVWKSIAETDMHSGILVLQQAYNSYIDDLKKDRDKWKTMYQGGTRGLRSENSSDSDSTQG